MRDLSDTPVHLERMQAAILARRSADDRWRMALELSGYVLQCAMHSVLQATGGDGDAARVRLVRVLHGETLARNFEVALAVRRRARMG